MTIEEAQKVGYVMGRTCAMTVQPLVNTVHVVQMLQNEFPAFEWTYDFPAVGVVRIEPEPKESEQEEALRAQCRELYTALESLYRNILHYGLAGMTFPKGWNARVEATKEVLAKYAPPQTEEKQG